MAQDFASYTLSKVKNRGQAVRRLYEGVELTSFTGFSEYHSCAGSVEEDEHTFLTRHPFPEGEILDVGANLGVVSLILGQRFPDRSIHAFEPNPSTVHALRKNLEYNAVDNVFVQDAAVGEESGTVTFDADPENRATARRASQEAEHARTTPCVTLDEYVEDNGIEEVALLKVDVEGYEKEVFEGAEGLLCNQRIKMVYFEVCPALAHRAGTKPEEPAFMLEEWGYRLHRIGSGGELREADLDEIQDMELENLVGSV
ncbi:FkbM family methyltransferase [Salinibacter ruber]|uniref:FkbM family methyltransferase n=1 Tax=Salinibacter ruber TaxID=146919 RepID=UPI002168491B|nr:FkbM family methyltransferase [Salinibacter ruber]